jgi:hypothetical protein
LVGTSIQLHTFGIQNLFWRQPESGINSGLLCATFENPISNPLAGGKYERYFGSSSYKINGRHWVAY